MVDMTDEGLIDYCELHCTTERALFHVKHIERMLELAGQSREHLPFMMAWKSFYAVHEDVMLPLVKEARARLRRSKLYVVQLRSSEMSHYERVKKFMLLAGQNIPEKPTDLDPETRVFRAKLIYEECVRELIGDGLGVTIVMDICEHADLTSKDTKLIFRADKPFNMIETMDGCADGPVVITGTAIAAGFNPEPVQELVDENNLAKFGPGGYRSDGTDGNAKGKWIKPPGHKPPDLKSELERQCGT